MANGNGFVPGAKVPIDKVQAPIDDEVAPKRPGAQKAAPKAAPGRKPSLETQIGATLVVVNLMLMSVPRLRDDALDQYEITALARSIDLQCRTSPRFRKYVESMLQAGSGAGLLGVCVLIGARRAARHDLIPRDFDTAFGSVLAGQAGKAPVEA